MLKNYLKTAWRNLFTSKTSSLINIGGLSVGLAVAIIIGLWIWDEFSFNKFHSHYDRIAQVMEQDTYNGTVHTSGAIPLPLKEALQKNYGSDLKQVVISSWTEPHVLSVGDKKLSYPGNFIGAAAPEMLSLHMLQGSRQGLKDPTSIIISHSVAGALFGEANPMGKVIQLDNDAGFTVTGVYEDLPLNSTFHNVAFMAPWEYYQSTENGRRSPTDWNDNSLALYVQIAGHADMAGLSEKIKNIKRDHLSDGENKTAPVILLQPMSRWHLYAKFDENGAIASGAIQYVRLFGIIGIFVLLLACINFMNLSTARSEKRSKEVGIRKAVGSLRNQLISQFFCESLLMAFLAFILSLFLVVVVLPFFNDIAGKNMTIPWTNPLCWSLSIGFTIITGLIAGSYPALYLSSFKPVKVLKGVFKAGRGASLPRKILVTLQFTVSVCLIIGTIVVFKQIQFAKDRPVGYSQEGLIDIDASTGDLHEHFEGIKADLLKSGAVTAIAESSSPVTGINNVRGDLEWKEKDPALTYQFGSIYVTPDYGKATGWQLAAGRDFNSRLLTDSSSLILNETAVKYMGLQNPLNETIRFRHRNYTVIGVVKDMVMRSPYDPIKPTIFYLGNGYFDNMLTRINPAMGVHEALDKIEQICKTWAPAIPFSWKFVDEAYARKFSSEERIGKLANSFAVLAILISCLGLFGMASFMAEQRIKEIGVRKVLGASVFNLWSLLSKDFVLLVLLSCIIAIPVAGYFLHDWLLNYSYRTTISWWVFALAACSALLITLVTVSFQSIKAALANPVKSLRTE